MRYDKGMRFLKRAGFLLIPLTLAVLAVLFFRPGTLPRTSASASDNLTGWAWNGEDEDGVGGLDGGFGWISFNCTNDPFDCTSTNYGVHINITTGVFSGYAWGGTGDPGFSPAGIGWIDFNLSVGCPKTPCEVRVDKGTGVVTGWARALSFGGGWDGWISLNCSSTDAGCGSSNYAVTLEILTDPGGRMQGFAWGGNDTDGVGCPGPNPPCVDGGPGWIEFDVVFNDVFNDPPVAVDDNCFANESIVTVSADLDVLANCGGPSPDFDPNGDPITITAVSALTPLTSGTITIIGGGTMLRYTPTPGFFSPPIVTFTYTITDGRGGFDTSDPITLFVYDCGDDIRQLAEVCDGTDFGPSTCQSEKSPLGESFVGGQLVCTPTCKIDTSQCVKQPTFKFREF